MNDQLELLPRDPSTEPCMYAKASAGAGDPATSFEAADKMNESGELGEHQEIVLALIRAYPGCSTRELAGVRMWQSRFDQRLDRYQIARRVKELRDAGLVGHRVKVTQNYAQPIEAGGGEGFDSFRHERAADGSAAWWPVEKGAAG